MSSDGGWFKACLVIDIRHYLDAAIGAITP